MAFARWPFAGGVEFKLPFGSLYSPNITPDKATGIGDWTDADFLGDGEEEMDVDGRRHAFVLHGLQCRQFQRNAGLVVEVARDDVTVVEEFGLRIDGYDVADLDAEAFQFRRVAGKRVNAQFHMLPADGQRIDLVIEGVARGLEGEDRTAIAALAGIDGDARAFRETGRPVADGDQFQPAVRLQRLHLCTQRIDMGDDGARAFLALPLPDRPDRSTARQFHLEPKRLQFARDMPDNGVSVSRGVAGVLDVSGILGDGSSAS